MVGEWGGGRERDGGDDWQHGIVHGAGGSPYTEYLDCNGGERSGAESIGHGDSDDR